MAHCLTGRGPTTAARQLQVAAAAAVWPRQLPRGNTTETASWDRLAFFAAASAAGAAALALLPQPAQCFYEQRPDGSVDRLKRWSARSWGKPYGENPAFHMKGVNPALDKYLPRLTNSIAAAENAVPTMLVPLCGKTHDMAFLCEHGFDVVGIEGVQRPILEFREEQRMHVKGLQRGTIFSFGQGGWTEGPSFEPAEEFKGSKTNCVFKLGDKGLGYYSDSPIAWRGKIQLGKRMTRALEVIQGDIFEITPQLVKEATSVKEGLFDVVYDRRSLDSIPLNARSAYVDVLSALMKPEGQILLLCVDFDESLVPVEKRAFPPYSISKSEVERLFPDDAWVVEVLGEKILAESKETTSGPGKSVREIQFLITKRLPTAENRSSSWGPGKYVGSAVLGTLGLGAALFFWRG